MEAEALLRKGIDPRSDWKRSFNDNRQKTSKRKQTRLSELIDMYITSSKTGENRPNTIKRKRFLLGEFLAHVGNQNVKNIKATHIEAWLEDYGTGKAYATKHGAFREVRALFIWAERREIILRSPHRAITNLKQPKLRPKEALTPKEIHTILETVGEGRLFRAIQLASHTAMRASEVVNLQWEHIDLEQSLIKLPHTKSGRFETIPIVPELAELFSAWRESGRERPVGYKHVADLSHEFRSVRLKLGLHEDKSFHSIRRMVATQLLANNESTFYVSKLLRHSSVAVTEASYAHILTDRLHQTAAHISKLFNSATACKGTLD